MQNPRLAGRYAKSLLDLALEQGVAEAVLQDMQLIREVTEQSGEFRQLLRSPVVGSDKKVSIIEAVLGDKIHALTRAFLVLLTRKGREYFLPEMTIAYNRQYKTLKKIHTVKLTTAMPLSDERRTDILAKLSDSISEGTVELSEIVDADIIGGYILEMDDLAFDNSIARDLRDIKKQFTKNLYIAEI